MSLPINFDLRNLYTPNTPQAQYPETHLDLTILRDALNNFAGVFSSGFQLDANAFIGINGAPVAPYRLNITASSTGALRAVSAGSATTTPTVDLFDSTHSTEAILSCSAGQIDFGAFSNHPLVLRTNNTEQVRIAATGAITTSSTLTTAGALQAIQNVNGTLLVQATNANAGTAAISRFAASNGTNVLIMEMYGTGFSGSFANQGWLYTLGAHPLILGTNGTERFRVKSTGQMRFQPLAADPGGLEDGDVWYNSTFNKLRVRAGGVTIDLH